MESYTIQTYGELKHLSFLRKVIKQEMTGRVHAVTAGQEEVIIISFCLGDIINTDDLTLSLRKFLSWPIVKFKWEACVVKPDPGWIAPEEAIATALRDLPIHRTRLNTYRCAFSKLSNITIKTIPIHRYNFADIQEYQHLYNLSLIKHSFNMTEYFQDMKSEDILLSRIRSVLLVFLMGHIIPAPHEEAIAAQKSSSPKGSFAARIMRTLRQKM